MASIPRLNRDLLPNNGVIPTDLPLVGKECDSRGPGSATGPIPGRRRWLRRLLGACLTAAVVGWPAALAQCSAQASLSPPTGLNVTRRGQLAGQPELDCARRPRSGYSVTSYNIYAGTSSGGESAVGSSSVTSDTVTGLTSGTTYYFYVTAVDRSELC